jgi:hypothetical protein
VNVSTEDNWLSEVDIPVNTLKVNMKKIKTLEAFVENIGNLKPVFCDSVKEFHFETHVTFPITGLLGLLDTLKEYFPNLTPVNVDFHSFSCLNMCRVLSSLKSNSLCHFYCESYGSKLGGTLLAEEQNGVPVSIVYLESNGEYRTLQCKNVQV